MKTVIYKNYEETNIYDFEPNCHDNIDEMIKSFVLSLQIPKGSFILDESIGSDFVNKVKQLTPQNINDDLLYILKEMAIDFPLINIKSVECLISKPDSSLKISLTLTVNSNIYLIFLEVTI